MSLASIASTGAATGTSSNAALSSLSSNFNSFLSLLMTQLKNQDPSSPVDTDQFTQELVEFSGVQQQVNTNTNLTSLIQLTQGESVEQASSLLGKQVTASSSDITLQGGTGSISFTAPSAEAATITITDASGNVINSGTVNATAGANNWTWNGANASGGVEPDGAYAISVTDPSGNPLSFDVTGTATGVADNAGVVDVDLGTQVIPLTNVVSVGSD